MLQNYISIFNIIANSGLCALFSKSSTALGHSGQNSKPVQHQIGQAGPRLNLKMAGPLGFEPRTFSLEGKQDVDLKAYREYLNIKYSKKYASLLFGYIIKYYQCFLNPNELLKIPASVRSNVMKAMISFAKYTSTYEEYKARLKNNGIK